MEKINKVEQCFKQTKKELYKILEYPIKKRWRKSYWNQPGIYEIKLNISEVYRIRESLKYYDPYPIDVEGSTVPRKRLINALYEITEDYNDK